MYKLLYWQMQDQSTSRMAVVSLSIPVIHPGHMRAAFKRVIYTSLRAGGIFLLSWYLGAGLIRAGLDPVPTRDLSGIAARPR